VRWPRTLGIYLPGWVGTVGAWVQRKKGY
jgi:hypothetical protein